MVIDPETYEDLRRRGVIDERGQIDPSKFDDEDPPSGIFRRLTS